MEHVSVTRLNTSCTLQNILAVSFLWGICTVPSAHVFTVAVQFHHQDLPAGGTPSSWPPASPSPDAPGGHPAAPPRISLPPDHHAQGRDTTHTEAPPLKGREAQGT